MWHVQVDIRVTHLPFLLPWYHKQPQRWQHQQQRQWRTGCHMTTTFDLYHHHYHYHTSTTASNLNTMMRTMWMTTGMMMRMTTVAWDASASWASGMSLFILFFYYSTNNYLQVNDNNGATTFLTPPSLYHDASTMMPPSDLAPPPSVSLPPPSWHVVWSTNTTTIH